MRVTAWKPAGTALVVAAVLAVCAAATPPLAHADTCTNTGGCGTPSCWSPSVRARPDMTRVLSVDCTHLIGATIKTQPAHGVISDVSVDYRGLHFTIHPDADAPRNDEAVFDLTGQEHTIQQTVAIE